MCICIRSVVHELPPTPSKFHYIFNLRDLSRIYNGLTMTTPDRFDKVYQFLRVWRNECVRVLFDRLINDTDRQVVHVRMSNNSLLNYCIEWVNRGVATGGGVYGYLYHPQINPSKLYMG